MKLLVYLAAAAVLGSAPPDFSGTWNMDAKRSESAHQDVAIGAVQITMRQTLTEIAIETTRKESKGSGMFHEVLTFKLDGTEMTVTGDGGVKVTTKAHWDGEKLVTETVRNVQDSTVTTMYVQGLDARGREMTLEKTLNVQHGYQGQTARTTGRGTDVFVKKN